MLFLYRPRQTWMPFALPRNRTQQAAYNRHLHETVRFHSPGPAAGTGGTNSTRWRISRSSASSTGPAC